MRRVIRSLGWLTALATVVILALLAWQCIDIYLSGSFRMDDIAQRLKTLAMPTSVYAVLLLTTGVVQLFGARSTGEGRTVPLDRLSCQSKDQHHFAASEKRTALIRWAMFGLAVLFIVLGVMNGGWYDVLVKAINICTECIGLG